jgi:hypothetical protein
LPSVPLVHLRVECKDKTNVSGAHEALALCRERI